MRAARQNAPREKEKAHESQAFPVHINCQPNSGHLIPLGIDPRRRAGAVPADTASSTSKSAPGKKHRNADTHRVCTLIKISKLFAR